MEKAEGVDLPLPTPEDDVPNKVCANVTFLGKWKTNFVSKSVFRLSRRSENSWPFDKFKVFGNFVFQVVFSKLKNEKRKSMSGFRFSGGRKTNGPLIHAFIYFKFIKGPTVFRARDKRKTDFETNFVFHFPKKVILAQTSFGASFSGVGSGRSNYPRFFLTIIRI